MCAEEQSLSVRDSLFDATWDTSITTLPASSIPPFGFLKYASARVGELAMGCTRSVTLLAGR